MQRGNLSNDNLYSGYCNSCITEMDRDGKEWDAKGNRLEWCDLCYKKARRYVLVKDGAKRDDDNKPWYHKKCLKDLKEATD